MHKAICLPPTGGLQAPCREATKLGWNLGPGCFFLSTNPTTSNLSFTSEPSWSTEALLLWLSVVLKGLGTQRAACTTGSRSPALYPPYQTHPIQLSLNLPSLC